jgi:hypothetical protein
MDPYVVAIWIVRIAFLGGLYLFMFGVTRLLLRDLRAAAHDPGGALARLVVVGSEVSDHAARSSAWMPWPRSAGT